MNPLVSVIVPHYNRNDLLLRVVSNVSEQEYRPIELIIVDDGSEVRPKDLPSIDRDVSVRVYHLDHSGLPGLVRNFGIEKAKGEFIAFLDSDDLWLPDKLSRQVAVLMSMSGVGLVHGNAMVKRGNCHTPLLGCAVDEISLTPVGLLKKNTVFTSSVMVRREILLETPFSGLPSAQDYELWLNLARKCHFFYLSEPLYIYDYECPDSVSRKSILRNLCLLRIFRGQKSHASSKEDFRIIKRRKAGVFFKLAKHSYLAGREPRSLKLLLCSIKISLNIHAVAALMLFFLNKDILKKVYTLKAEI